MLSLCGLRLCGVEFVWSEVVCVGGLRCVVLSCVV